MVPDAELKADQSAIIAHLSHITRRWHELAEPCLLEIVHLSAEDRAEVKQVSHYKVDPDNLTLAASDIAAMNRHRINSYATVNPVNANNRPKAGKRASAEHVVASFFHWADADDGQAADNIKNFVGPKYTFHVLTGRTPCARPHVYWELDEPTRDWPAWEATQKAIAATLKTDPAVTDPPRIMRIGGTVNWPKPQKQAKGYIPELTSVRIFDAQERPAVTSERMARAFVPVRQETTGGEHFEIETDNRRSAGDYAEILRQARTDGDKHRGVRSLTASLAGAGVPRGLTEAIVREACPVWDENVESLIEGAYRKFYKKPELQDIEITPEQAAQISPTLFRPWVSKDLTAIPYPQFIYSDFYARGYTSVTLAAPKVGKSMLGLAEALDMATGRGFLTGKPRDPLVGVYYNAEDDQNVVDARVSALLTHYGIDQSEIEGRFYPHSGVEDGDFFMVSGQDPIINEALFIGLEKFCEEVRADFLIFDPLQDLTRSPETNEVFRALGQRIRKLAAKTGVALGLIHHTRKVAPGASPSIDDMRGGSSLRGTARFNRILVSMTEDEAAKAGLENHRHYFRIGDMESNLAPPSSDVNRWYQKISVEAPNGHHIGAVEAWQWPDAFNGISPEDARRVQLRIGAMEDDPPAENVQSKNWVGYVVADILGLQIEDKAHKSRVQNMVRTWVKNGVLEVVEVRNQRAGRDIKAVIAGSNNPAAEVRT